jgi:hypothetical protein
MTAPKTATMEPIISNLSGLFLSTIIPHNIEEIIKNPPYAAYTLPKSAVCRVGITLYVKRTMPPTIPKIILFFCLIHKL